MHLTAVSGLTTHNHKHTAPRMGAGQRAREEARAEEAAPAFAHKQVRARVTAVMHAVMHPPVGDFIRAGKMLENAAELAAQSIGKGSSGTLLTGRDILQQMVTEQPLTVWGKTWPNRPATAYSQIADQRELPTSLFTRLAVPHRQLVDTLTGSHPEVSALQVNSWLNQAFTRGVIIRLSDRKDGGKTYYAVPYEVQEALNLAPPARTAATAQPASASPSKSRLVQGLEKYFDLYNKAFLADNRFKTDATHKELFEMVAEMGRSFIQRGQVAGFGPDQLPEKMVSDPRFRMLGDTPPGTALLSVMDFLKLCLDDPAPDQTASDTRNLARLHDITLALGKRAVEAGIMTGDDAQQLKEFDKKSDAKAALDAD